MGGKASFTPAFDAWRFYADGTESGSSPYGGAAQNANVTVDLGGGNVQIHLRARVQETGGADGATTDDWGLEYQVNGAGGWTAIAAASSRVQADTGSTLTDGSATTNRATNGISDGTGSFVAGEQEEANGVIEDRQLTASNFTEHVWALLVIAADNANADTLGFRITLNGGNPGMTNSVTPVITIQKPVDLLANDVSSATSVSAPVVGQKHALTATSVSSSTSVTTPALAEVVPLLANDVSSTTNVGAPAIGQVHGLAANDVSSTTNVGTPSVGQIHSLTASSISSTTSVTTPALAEVGGTDDLLAEDLTSATSVSAPVVGQVHGLLATGVSSVTSLSSPVLAEIAPGTDVLLAEDISSATILTLPTLSIVQAAASRPRGGGPVGESPRTAESRRNREKKRRKDEQDFKAELARIYDEATGATPAQAQTAAQTIINKPTSSASKDAIAKLASAIVQNNNRAIVEKLAALVSDATKAEAEIIAAIQRDIRDEEEIELILMVA